jgi:hypothetical protein
MINTIKCLFQIEEYTAPQIFIYLKLLIFNKLSKRQLLRRMTQPHLSSVRGAAWSHMFVKTCNYALRAIEVGKRDGTEYVISPA